MRTSTKMKALYQESAHEGDVDDDFLARFSEDTGWKSILLYQFISGYIAMISISVVAANAIVWLESMHVIISKDDPAIYKEQPKIIYFIYLLDFMYVIDIVFRIFYSLTNWPNKKLNYEPAPVECILIDIVTVIPYDALYYSVQNNPLIVTLLRLRVFFRLYRILIARSQVKQSYQAISAATTIFWTCCLKLLFLIIPAAIHYLAWCQMSSTTCRYRDYYAFIKTYIVAVKIAITSGPDLDSFKIDAMYHLHTVFSIVYCTATVIIVSKLVCARIDQLKSDYIFVDEYSMTMDMYKSLKRKYKSSWTFEDERIYHTLKDYYYHFSRQRNGLLAPDVLHRILPPSLTNAIVTDMAYDALKHSHVFRNLEVNLLRHLSSLITFEFAVPGEVIIKKGESFNKMIYISHGVLQILSNEDGETPVLNLSGGTSLGESTLFISYPSSCTVLCQTYCELVVLCKKDLTEMIKYYPNEYRNLVRVIFRRYKEAKTLYGIVRKKMNPNLVKCDLLIMSWIKQFQRTILNEDVENAETKTKGLNYYIDNLIFYIAYLDKLVVSEEIELVKDSVFLKSSFHFILQPNSPILILWSIIVVLLTILFVIIYPYNLCFARSHKSVQTVYTIFITIIYIVDLYLQLFTAVRTRGATYLTFRRILVYRIKKPVFLLDVIATFPIEIFILLLAGNMQNITYMALQSNRLLKYYKVNKVFTDLIIWNANLLTFFHYVKYFIHGLVLYYYATMLIYLTNCFNGECTAEFEMLFVNMSVTNNLSKLAATFPLSTALITGVNLGRFPEPNSPIVYGIYLLIIMIAFVYNMLFAVTIISTTAVENLPLLEEQERLLAIRQVLRNFYIDERYDKGIKSYLDLLYYFDNRKEMHINNTMLPPDLEAACNNIHMIRLLNQNPFFKGMCPKVLSSFTRYTTKVMIPAGLVIFYCSETIDECYILQSGYCTVLYGTENKEVTTNENLGLIEALLNVPVFHTICTLTDCILLKIKKRDLMRFFSHYEVEEQILEKALEEFSRCEHLLSRFTRFKVYHRDIKNRVHVKIKFRFMPRECILHILYSLKHISTGSKLLFYWDLLKNVALIVNFTITAAKNFEARSQSRVTFLNVSLYILDVIPLMDIFIRCFVSYYDENGIEIISVTKTIPHYLSHSFLADLLGAFPFDYIISGGVFYTRMNRLIQMYRIIGMTGSLTHRIKKVRQFRYFSFFLLFIALAAYIGMGYVSQVCTFDLNIPASRNFVRGVNCLDDSWLSLTPKQRPMNRRKIFTEIYMLLLGVFCGIGFRRYVIENFYERLLLGIWSVIGHLFILLIIGRAVAHNLFKNADLTIYQEAMKDLVSFLSYCDIDKVVKHEVIQYFEYIWEKRGGKNIIDVISTFPTSLKKDILFSIYGRSLKMNQSIFVEAEDSFLKNLLLYAKQSTFRNTGILYRVDDILDRMYFLLRGSIEVVGPDTNKLDTLGPGSLFGCLDNCHQSRQTLTMVANGHVETLSFTSDHYHKLLAKHPTFQKRYNYLTKFNVDYMASSTTGAAHNTMTRSMSQVTGVKVLRRLGTRIYKPNKYIRFYEIFLFVLEFFIGSMFELTLQVIKITLPYLLTAYVRDFLWMLRIYLKFHVAYEDEYGKLVYDRKRIALKYLKQKFGFYFDLIGILPIDLMIYIFYNGHVSFIVFRLNRFLRVYHLFNYMGHMTNKLNINVMLVRTVNTLMYAYIYLELKFFFYYLVDTQWKYNESLPNSDRLLEAANFLDTVIVMFTTAGVPYTTNFRGYTPMVLSAFICMDVCFIVFFLSNFTSTLQIATKVKSEYRQHCLDLELLMLICDASKPYIESISLYTNIFLKIRNGVQFPFLLEEAPYYLREAVLDSMFGFHLRNHYIFKNCHIDFLRQLSATMRTLMYFDGNHICDMGDIDETMYFIQEGMVQALTKDTLYTEVCEHLLIAGDCFGLNQILYPRVGHYYAYRASMLTIVVTVKRSKFMRLVAFFPSAKKHIYQSMQLIQEEEELMEGF